MKVSLDTMKSWFKKGLYPTESQFASVFDSFWHKDDAIPMASVQNLTQTLNNKASAYHKHEMSDITDIADFESSVNAKIAGKAEADHRHTFADVDGLDEALNKRPHAYTLDFGTAGEMVQDVAMLGAGTITRVITRNVSRLFVTNAANVRQEVSLIDTPSIGVSDGDILTWEIERTTDDELACVGVLFELSSTN
jgi:hypothetical protein